MTRSLSRGLDVLEALARASERELGPSAIAQRVGLDKATVTRLLRTLVEGGYVVQDEASRRYRLTGRILWLAHGVAARIDLRSVALPHLTALRDELGETVHLGVMEDLRVVYVDKLEADNSIQLVSAIGQTMPLHSTSLGKAMLAALPDAERARQQAIRRANDPLGLAASLVHGGQGAMEPLHDRLAGIAVPTLVVIGADDPARGRAEEVAARIPAARLVVIAGAGHAPHLERPDRFHAVALDFLLEAAP